MQPNFHHDPMAGADLYTFIRACFNSLDRANELLLSDPSLLQQRTRLGETPLHFLAVENQIEAVRWLAANGAVIETTNRVGDTPLSDVASLGYLDLVRFLLETGADVNHKSHTGDFVVHESVRSGNPEIVDLVIQYGANRDAVNPLQETPLHIAAKNDALLEVTKFLVNRGAVIDALAAFQTTPLILSALNGCGNSAKYLVSVGASLSSQDCNGRTPAEMAREAGHQELAKWLDQAKRPA